MLAFDAVEIAVPDAGVAGLAEKNEGVGERFEPVCDGGFESLIRLSVVVHDESLIFLMLVELFVFFSSDS